MCSDQAVQVRGIEPVKVCGIRHAKIKLPKFQFDQEHLVKLSSEFGNISLRCDGFE
jgi:hypothetical protein